MMAKRRSIAPLTAAADREADLQRRPTAVFEANLQHRPSATAYGADLQRRPTAVFEANLQHRPSATAYGADLQRRPTAVSDANLQHRPSATAYGADLQRRPTAVFEANLQHRPSATAYGAEFQRRPTAIALDTNFQRRPTAIAFGGEIQRRPTAVGLVVPPVEVPLAKVYEEDEEELQELFRPQPARQGRSVFYSLLILTIVLLSLLGLALLLFFTFGEEVEHTTSSLMPSLRYPGGPKGSPLAGGDNATSARLSGNRPLEVFEEHGGSDVVSGERDSESTLPPSALPEDDAD
ncbi:uncharacterized protein LOC144119130 [Amblyomma americanum]